MNQWLKIRKELYLNSRKLVSQRLGQATKNLKKYETSYQNELNKKWKISTKEKLIQTVRHGDVLLLGDFHAVHQSQKAHIRILRELHRPSEYVLGLECFFVEDQNLVDQFQQGELTEKDFLKKIQWSKKWGFPWSHYRKMVQWAIKNNVKIVALNIKTVNLTDRDKKVAFELNKYMNELKKKAVVIYGDFHLAKEHIPKQLRALNKKIKIVRIFQNPEELFFKIIKNKNHLDVDLLQDKNDFCLLSVPPWVKWQNYLLYLDEQGDKYYNKYYSEEIDFSDRVYRYLDLISTELNVPVNKSEISIFTFRDDNFWKILTQKVSDNHLKLIQKWIESELSFYIPELKIGYLSRASVNHMSWLSMQIVIAQLSKNPKFIYNPNKNFEAYVWIQTLSYFGNKICNPKKKSDTLLDFKIALTNVSESKNKKEAYKIALAYKLQELLVLTGQRKINSFSVQSKITPVLLAGELLGGLYGEKLYYGWSKKLLSAETLKNFMGKDLHHKHFKKIFTECIEFVENLPEPFRSKKDKL